MTDRMTQEPLPLIATLLPLRERILQALIDQRIVADVSAVNAQTAIKRRYWRAYARATEDALRHVNHTFDSFIKKEMQND